MEEAGLDADIQGILRFEYGFGTKGYVRLRCVFGAKQRDESAPLKQEADEETYGAEWLTVHDLKLLAKKDPGLIAKLEAIPRVQAVKAQGGKKRGERLRSTETIRMFEWVEKGTTTFSSTLYRGYDGEEINNSVVRVNTCFTTNVILKNKANGKYRVLTKEVAYPKAFDEIGLEVANMVLAVKVAALDGICGILHRASRNSSANAEMTFSFLLELDQPQLKKQSNVNVSEELSLEEVTVGVGQMTEAAIMAVENVENGVVAPIDFMVREGSPHLPL